LTISDDFTVSSNLPPAAPQPGQVTQEVVIVAGAGEAATKAVGTVSALQPPTFESGPLKGSPSILKLDQPVDSTVPVSRFNPNAPMPGFSLPAGFDLNALPPTGAGPSELSGFPVARVSQEEASLQVRSDGGLIFGGQRLFVYHGIPSTALFGGDPIQVPQDAFAHTDPTAIVHLDARLINGSPLPSWLKFEGLRGTFSGVPPEGLGGSLEIEVIARDTEGREARASFVLLLDGLRSAEGLQAQDIPDLMLGLDVDSKEAEKARLEAAKRALAAQAGDKARPGDGKPQKPAASFTDQVRAAKSGRDPLLDRIAGTPPNGPGTRR
jgi:hypothetical protein